MRLTCPNCGAQYEVPDDVIPDAGRDVQCSNCGDTWFQHHPDHSPTDDAGAAERETGLDDGGWDRTDAEDLADAEDASAVPAPMRRELDPAVADVLRQEAEQEARARAAESGTLESQPDLGLDDGDSEALRRNREARERMARLRGKSTDDAGAEPLPDINPGARSALLPDIEEINSSLRADADDPDSMNHSDGYPEAMPHEGGGFRRGFLLVVLLAVILLLIYVYAPQIAARLPATEAVLADYTRFVDGLRASLDGIVARILQGIGGTEG